MLWAGAASAIDPIIPASDAQRAYEDQRARARVLIQQRAAREARARQARIESRRRAGISLLRPRQAPYVGATTAPLADTVPGVNPLSGR
jgi:hypothetical protein